jgi:hypothetical protein
MQNKNLFLLSFPNASNFIEDKVRKINKSLKTLEKSNQQKTLHKTIKEAAETFYCYIPNYIIITTTSTQMKKTIFAIMIALASCANSYAQLETVQNRPYTDLRKFHYGILVGTHLQDIEFNNIGPQLVTLDDGTQQELIISADQSSWEPGFTVGVLGELRLNTHFQFRVAPALYFGTRKIQFINHTPATPDARPEEHTQDMKTAYVSCAADIIFAAPRFNNHRPYIMAGVNPMLNLSGSSQDYLQMKRMDLFFEVGLGCDFYLPFFKLRPELKFMLGLTNALDTKHADDLQDKTMRLYTNSVSEARSKIIALTFYFE